MTQLGVSGLLEINHKGKSAQIEGLKRGYMAELRLTKEDFDSGSLPYRVLSEKGTFQGQLASVALELFLLAAQALHPISHREGQYHLQATMNAQRAMHEPLPEC
jgi:hypothetical protein